MPPPYQPAHWNVFANTPYQAQGPVGVPPATWRNRFNLGGVPQVGGLPDFHLDRNAVRAICRDPRQNVLFGYVCAMAWGGQGDGNGRRNPINAWAHAQVIAVRLTALRMGGLTRSEAYNLFCNGGEIPGLGPSFFTKLLYFFSPTPSFFIMDQWTAKSVNLLTGTRVVRMYGSSPTRDNTGGNYQAFCEEVDLMAGLIGCAGQEAEERLFSQGGRHSWPWRAYVAHAPPPPRYNAAQMRGNYPHIHF